MNSVARIAANRRSNTNGQSSVRNLLPCVVTAIVHGQVHAEVGLLVNERTVIDAMVSNSGIEALDIHPGGRVLALIKATFVTLFSAQPGLTLAERNTIGGRVTEIVRGTVQSEVVVDIGGGREIAAVITTCSLDSMNLSPGTEVLACFNPSNIMLAVED